MKYMKKGIHCNNKYFTLMFTRQKTRKQGQATWILISKAQNKAD